jgi:hypothetical protein
VKAGFQPQKSLCKDRNNNLIGNDRVIMERLKQYFYETLNFKDDVEIRQEIIYQEPEEHTEPPTKGTGNIKTIKEL